MYESDKTASSINFLLCIIVLTGRESLVRAGGQVPSGAVGLHGNRVVSATGDAAHQAVRVLRVAASVTAWGGQGGDERAGSFGVGPCDVCHCLSHLIYCYVHRAAGLCETNTYIDSSSVLFVKFYFCKYENPECRMLFL